MIHPAFSAADRIFPLKAGQWIGPIKINSQHAFFKCIGKDSARAQTFDEVQTEIEKILKPMWWKNIKQDYIGNIRKDVKIVIFPEKLKSIKINGSSPILGKNHNM